MSSLNRVLILGTGPASVQLAVTLKNKLNCYIGIVGRQSVRSEPFFTALRQSNQEVRAEIQNEKHRQMQGDCIVDQVFQGYESITGQWDTLILAVTTDAYVAVLKKTKPELLKQVESMLLLSPTFGSNSLVRHYMKDIQPSVEIISFSTYSGDTRWAGEKPSDHVITTAVKKKVFIGSTHGRSPVVSSLCELYGMLGTTLEVMGSPMEAESRNISLYVHPPLFMNEFSLGAVFGEADTKKYVYKMFPEGPITQGLIRDMLAAWKEMMSLLDSLRFEGINLLKFMTDDNYPVRLESLSRHDIENFVHLETIHQEYLLYIRYTSLLIDPFSEPDQDGRYFDFSAVPIRQIFVDREGYWDIPRMPKEDYYRIKIIQGIARHLKVKSPTIDKFIATYEGRLLSASEALQGQRLSSAFAVQSFEEDLKMICTEIGKQNELLEELK
ncbi:MULTISPECIES: opine metallophore biosynthesis dehydrogenase [Paenibacillus]|uniref:opine metallophore biosynthesis dehydrogenase n=1 Tax=Paenibacillus TaxID=44249 RepID=UPI0022B8FF83|nr:opine metallophore biosynthesis dehydrogenase [Paenibacillus caseinilyticus]MCZ8521262.1 opine metallophore biosynthesis dehydrogenase [Paenibacillus caseinilyticus]